MTAPATARPTPADAVDWRTRAACADGDPETADLFFCDGYTWDNTHNRARAADAKAICARCPVQVECRTWATATGLPYAIAGGLTDLERRDQAPARGRPPGPRPPCGTPAAYQAHRRRGEKPCPPCRTAFSQDRQRRKGAAA